MNLTEWLILASMFLGLFGGLVTTINALLKNQWIEHKEIHKDIKEQIENQSESIHDIQVQVGKIETVCHLRQYPRVSDGT